MKHWVFDEDHGFPTEADPPAVVPAGEVVVLATYGSLFFASAAWRSRRSCRGAVGTGSHGVVVLRLRAKEELGSTVVKMLIRYGEQLAATDARLMLCGVTPGVRGSSTTPGSRPSSATDAVFMAHARVGLSVQEAVSSAEQWIAESTLNS